MNNDGVSGRLPVKVYTCHASNDPWRFKDGSSLHVLCGNDPSLPVASCYQCNICRPEYTRNKDQLVVLKVLAQSPLWWKLVLPARVISHFHNLLFEGLALLVLFIAQSLKIYHSVFLLVATADAVCANPSCMAQSKMISSSHFGLVCASRRYFLSVSQA